MKNPGNKPQPSVEDALKATAENVEELAAKAQEQLEWQLSQGKARAHQWQGQLEQTAEDLGRRTEFYVHQNPWKAVGIAAVVACLLGLLLNRR